MFLLCIMTVAILVSQIKIVFSLLGAVTGNMLGFILPAAIYLKIVQDRKAAGKNVKKTGLQTCTAWMCVIIGFISMFTALVANITNII